MSSIYEGPPYFHKELNLGFQERWYYVVHSLQNSVLDSVGTLRIPTNMNDYPIRKVWIPRKQQNDNDWFPPLEASPQTQLCLFCHVLCYVLEYCRKREGPMQPSQVIGIINIILHSFSARRTGDLQDWMNAALLNGPRVNVRMSLCVWVVFFKAWLLLCLF